MPDYDAGFKIVARNAGQPLTRLAGVDCHEWEPIGGEVQAVERLADRTFRARHGRERFVVYIEAYTRWNRAAPWSVLAKSGLLAERERLPTVSLVFILLRRGYRPQDGTLRLAALGAATQQVWFREICMWEQEPQSWWEDHPGLMALYPLCEHRSPPHEVLTHAADAIVAHAADSVMRADLLATLAIFGKLDYPAVDVLRLIGREQMKESKFFEEVMAEGEVVGRRAALLEFLDHRFGAGSSVEFEAALRAINDLQQLQELFRAAITCRRITEFRRRMKDVLSES
jgi:hypothetical protein